MKFLKSIFCTILISMFLCINAFASETSYSTTDLDSVYKNIYEDCLNQTSSQITDEFSAYSYLLHNKELISIQNGQIKFHATESKLNSEQLRTLNSFIKKVNRSVELKSLKVNSDLSFSVVHAPKAADRPVLLAESMDLMPECRAHAAELREVYDNAILGTQLASAGIYFAERVKGGGIWDYKAYLGLNTQYFETELRAMMTGETVGNFHYGYVGSEVFSPTVLKAAAGLVQITSGTAKLEWFSTYFDDPSDQSDIQWGIDIYNGQ